MKRHLVTLLNHLRCVCHRMRDIFRAIQSRTRSVRAAARPHLVKAANQAAHVSCIVTRSVVRFFTYRVYLETIFVPKQLRVSDYWLSAITWRNNHQISVVELARAQDKRPLPLDEALVRLEQEWTNARSDFPQETIPIFCLHDVNPFVGGVRALLLPNLPKGIERQIVALRLCNPVDLPTQVGPKKFGMLGKTVVDLGHDRFLVIGNAQWFCNTLATLGERFSIPRDRIRAVSQIKDMMCRYNIVPLSSVLLIGGFGTIFAFEAAFLVTRIQGINTNTFTFLLFAFVLSLLGILAFLVQEAFESKLVAFTPWWTVISKMIGWVVFLFALGITPFSFFVPVNSRLLCEATRCLGFLLMTACAVTTMGQIFYQSGMSKRTALIWWLFLMFSVTLLPLLDFVIL